MYGSSGLLPARFLILMAHLITTITLLWARDENVKACLPLQFTEVQYQYKDTQNFPTTVWELKRQYGPNIHYSVYCKFEWNRRHYESISSDNYRLIVGLSVTLVLTLFELCSLFAGISLFSHLTSLISILCHCGACISLFYFMLDEWDCDLYWWIFALTSVIPSFTETLAIVRILLFKKGL